MMNPAEIIRIKRDGGELSREQIEFLIQGGVAGTVADYQLSAWLMAVFLRGMSTGELGDLTHAMMFSGEQFDLSEIHLPKVDKHSTGGVGDKTSLIIAPLAAACGLAVPMVSGRGLGHTGGTLDKLEAIPGFTTQLTQDQFKRQTERIGLAMGAQTPKFVPADRKLYALRDVTATVESIPLIAASIMSKKLAVGNDALVLDVKTGNGAFMTRQKDAIQLAKTMIEIGERLGRSVSAMITDMSQPLGVAVGNANEVVECIESLRGGGPKDLMDLSYALTARMMRLGGLVKKDADAMSSMRQAIESGAALEKFRLMIEHQGGDPRCVDDLKRLPRAAKTEFLFATKSGWVSHFETRMIGVAATALGAGRVLMSDAVDTGVGLRVCAKIGDRMEKDQPIFEITWRESKRLDEAKRILEKAFTIAEEKVDASKLILKKDV